MISDLHYITMGTGEDVVFQHGLTADSRQINDLCGGIESIRLISMDCPGHGRSLLNPGYQVSFTHYADSLIGLLDSLKIQKAIFGGLSMGSGIALNIAMCYPERVKGLILLRPAWLDQINPENLIILKQASAFMTRPNGRADFIATAGFKQLSLALPKAADSLLGIFKEDQQKVLPDVITRMVEDRPMTDLSDLGSLTLPTLIIGNDDDPLHPFFIAEKWHKHIENSSLIKVTSRYLDGDRHRSEVRSHILEFLKNI